MKSLTATAVSLARHLAGDISLRRKALGMLTLLAAALLFLGVTLFARTLENSPLLFLGYWLACAWIVLTLILLASYDLLLVLGAARKERRALERNLKSGENPTTKSRSSNTSSNP